MRSAQTQGGLFISVELVVSWRSEQNTDAMHFGWVKFLLISALVAGAFACKKMPPKSLNYGKKQSGDNGYRLVIGNNPDEGYEPGKIYNCMC